MQDTFTAIVLGSGTTSHSTNLYAAPNVHSHALLEVSDETGVLFPVPVLFEITVFPDGRTSGRIVHDGYEEGGFDDVADRLAARLYGVPAVRKAFGSKPSVKAWAAFIEFTRSERE